MAAFNAEKAALQLLKDFVLNDCQRSYYFQTCY